MERKPKYHPTGNEKMIRDVEPGTKVYFLRAGRKDKGEDPLLLLQKKF